MFTISHETDDTKYNHVILPYSSVLPDAFMITIMIAELSTSFLACFGVFLASQAELHDLVT